MEIDQKLNGASISTLIFMDLETTGLPCDVGKKNVHITEMSFVAIDRASFEDDKSLRAINKLSLCIRPRSVVSPGAMHVTGLYNDVLENQEEFDDSVPKLLEYFFRRLQRPICLLAHNGNKFDFPVLQAELKRVNYSLASDVLCADTLVAFRSICLSPKPVKDIQPQEVERQSQQNVLLAEEDSKPQQEEMQSQEILLSDRKDLQQQKEGEKERQSTLTKSCRKNSVTEDDIEILLSQDLEMFISMSETTTPPNKIVFESAVTSNTLALAEKSEFLDPALNEKTPTSCRITSNFNANGKNVRKRKIPDSTYTHVKEHQRDVRPVKRCLFSEPEPLKPHKITKFNLESLYCHFFNEKPPNGHHAEVDCISLSKVCQKINKDFLLWIDKHCVPFCDMNALW